MYQVKFYTGNYRTRQRQANADGAIAYFEQHFNACGSPTPNYAMCVVGSNASKKSKAIATSYCNAIAQGTGLEIYAPDEYRVGGRGNGNLRHTAMPAVLLEPCFISCPDGAALVKSEHGRRFLAEALVDVIHRHFPNGGLVAFSIGHKGKVSNPADRGARAHGGGHEAEVVERISAEPDEPPEPKDYESEIERL